MIRMTPAEIPQLIGSSEAILELREQVARVACSTARVLITGESGSGKGVVAKAIATSVPNARSGTFVSVNCVGISEALLEIDLFGQMTPGNGDHKIGKLELADNGTVFLNEIGELSPKTQSLLLRFFETGEVQRVGADRVMTASNVRVVSATNRD